ncbi:MAG: glycosyltransferase family 2 protein [Pseudomonadota bacterium]
MATPELSLVIPALNESAIILGNVDELSSWLIENLPDISYEVIVVNDGSTDGMGELLEEARAERPWLQVAHHPTNMGRGRGVRTGFAHARGDFVICLDADLSYTPDHIPGLLEPLRSGEADLTLASAHHPQGSVVNVPLQRELLSRWGNRVLRLGYDRKYYTVTCVVRGYARHVIDTLELVSDGKDLHLEIIQKAQLMGYRILEVPATLKWRNKQRHRNTKFGLPEFALFKMRRTVLSHLIFNYITNPGVLLLIPILALLAAIVFGCGMLAIAFIHNLAVLDASLMQVARLTLLNGQLTLLVVSFAFIFLMVFVGFYFLSFQSKRYFDETYTLMMRMNSRIRRLEED